MAGRLQQITKHPSTQIMQHLAHPRIFIAPADNTLSAAANHRTHWHATQPLLSSLTQVTGKVPEQVTLPRQLLHEA